MLRIATPATKAAAIQSTEEPSDEKATPQKTSATLTMSASVALGLQRSA